MHFTSKIFYLSFKKWCPSRKANRVSWIIRATASPRESNSHLFGTRPTMMCTVGWKKHGCLDLTSTFMLKAMFYIFFTLALLCLCHSVSCFTAGMQEKKRKVIDSYLLFSYSWWYVLPLTWLCGFFTQYTTWTYNFTLWNSMYNFVRQTY